MRSARHSSRWSRRSSPRSVIARRAGPAVFQNAYGPVTATSVIFARGVTSRHGPKWTSRVSLPTSTQALEALMPNARAVARYDRAKAKSNRSTLLTGAILRSPHVPTAHSRPPRAVALSDIERELSGRYAGGYRVRCTGSPDEALEILAGLPDGGEEVALVLAAQRAAEHHRRGAARASAASSTRMRSAGCSSRGRLGAQADRRGDPRLDRPRPDRLLRPDGRQASPDEVFHQAISSFLLEWATDRRIVPQTIHIVGETWSGRAYELREVLERCAVPHTFCLADSDRGTRAARQGRPDAKLPLMVLPDGRVLTDPSTPRSRRPPGPPVRPRRSTPSTS